MAGLQHPSLAIAYQSALRDLLSGGTVHEAVTSRYSAASGFGRKPVGTREMLNYSFSIEDPHACLIDSLEGALRTDIRYAFGLLAWSATGRDDLAGLATYNPLAHLVSSDGFRVDGSCGSRIFGVKSGSRPWDQALSMIRHDRNTGRCVIPIVVGSDNRPDRLGYPCAISLQFFVRGDRLVSVATFRSQSALTYFAYDAFFFMNLHILFANELGLMAGEYHQTTGTLHLYDSDVQAAQFAVEEGILSVDVPRIESGPGVAVRALADLHDGVQTPTEFGCDYLSLATLALRPEAQVVARDVAIRRIVEDNRLPADSPLSVSRLLRQDS